MATFTISSAPWPAGTAVSAYLAEAWVEPGSAPSGEAAATGVVSSASTLQLDGLADNRRYVAYALGMGVKFATFAKPAETTDVRLTSAETALDSLGNSVIGRVLDVWGHSYAEGAGVLHTADSFAEKLGVLLNCSTVQNHGISSSILGPAPASPLTYASSVYARVVGSLPFATTPQPPMHHIAVIYSAVNDLGTVGGGGAVDDPAILTTSLRAIICKLRHALGGQTSDASWAFAQGTGATGWGAVTTNGGVTTNSRATGDNGNTWTITLPSTFPGGVVEVFNYVNNAGGSVHAITVDGNPQASWDTRGSATATNRPLCYRTRWLAAGAHTIIGTITNRIGIEYMQFWTVASNDPPPIAYANLNRAPAYPHPFTDAQINNVNATLNLVADEFSSGVVCVNVDNVLGYTSANANQTNFDMVGHGAGTPSGGTAGVHPNQLGHALIADAFADALRDLSPTPGQLTLAKVRGRSFSMLWSPTLSESAGATNSQYDPHNKDRSAVLTLVAGTVTWTNRAIDANTRIGGLTAIGDPAGASAGTVGIVSITPSAGTTAGTIVIKSTNAADTRSVHIWIYQADVVTAGINPPSHLSAVDT